MPVVRPLQCIVLWRGTAMPKKKKHPNLLSNINDAQSSTKYGFLFLVWQHAQMVALKDPPTLNMPQQPSTTRIPFQETRLGFVV